MLKTWYALYTLYRAFTLEPEQTYEAACLDINPRLIEQLKVHEGVRQFPYVDTVGKLTIGVGHNLTDNGLSLPIIDRLLIEDLEQIHVELDRNIPEWCDLSENRRMVLLNMGFNLGIPRLLTFRRFLAALDREDYEVAAAEMLDSKWARQVGDRATELSRLMVDG